MSFTGLNADLLLDTRFLARFSRVVRIRIAAGLARAYRPQWHSIQIDESTEKLCGMATGEEDIAGALGDEQAHGGVYGRIFGQKLEASTAQLLPWNLG